jgi:hypothetical protein
MRGVSTESIGLPPVGTRRIDEHELGPEHGKAMRGQARARRREKSLTGSSGTGGYTWPASGGMEL